MKLIRKGSVSNLTQKGFIAKSVLYAHDIQKVLWPELPAQGENFSIAYDAASETTTAVQGYCLYAEYNITDISKETQIMLLRSSNPTCHTIIIDDNVIITNPTSFTYQFDTTGLHTAKFLFDYPELHNGHPYNNQFFDSSVPVTKIIVFEGHTVLNLFSLSESPATEIILPNGLKEIQWQSVARCKNINNIIIPPTANKISGLAFHDCTGLSSFVVPDSVLIFGEESESSPLQGCVNIESLVIGSGVTQTSVGHFRFPKLLTLIYNGHVPLGEHVLYRNIGSSTITLNSVTLGKNFNTIDYLALVGYNVNKINSDVDGEWNLPDNITVIANLSLLVQSVKKIKFPKNLREIGELNIFEFTEIEELIFPDNLETIKARTVQRCDKLKYVELPTNLKVLLYDTFSYCINLSKVKYKGVIYTYVNDLHAALLKNNVLVSIDSFKSTALLGQFFIDLGLPSGNLWAFTNLGTTIATRSGDYYQWADVVKKDDCSVITKDTTPYYDAANSITTQPVFDAYTKYNDTDNLTHLEAIDDVVTTFYKNPNYFIPSISDFNELLENTTQTIVDNGGMKCVSFASTINPNKSILIPCGGAWSNGRLTGVNEYGYVWLSDLKTDCETTYLSNNHSFPATIRVSNGTGVNPEVVKLCYEGREQGLNIRPVYNSNKR